MKINRFEKLCASSIENDIPRERHASIERDFIFYKYEQIVSSQEKIIDVLEKRIEELEKTIENVSCRLVYRPPQNDPNLLDESTPIGKKYKKAIELTKDTKTIDFRGKNERKSSKTVKKKSKKVSAKCDKTAVESV